MRIRSANDRDRVLQQAAAAQAAAQAAQPRIIAGITIVQNELGQVAARLECDPAVAALLLDIAREENLKRLKVPASKGPPLVVAGRDQMPPSPPGG